MAQQNLGFEIEEQAQRQQLKASITVDGLSGTSKSGVALMFAYALAKKELPEDTSEEDVWKYVGASDSEKRALNLYVDSPVDTSAGEILLVRSFRKANLTYYSPKTYLSAREYMVERFDIKSYVMDSYTHSWIGQPGGVLDMVSNVTDPQYKKSPWNEPEVRENKKLLFDLLRDDRVHTIATVRVKEGLDYTKNDKGGLKIESVGLQQIQQDMLKYEPDLGISMIEPGKFKVHKSRYVIFKVGEIYEMTWSLANELADYLSEGVDPETIIEQRRQDIIKGLKEMAKQNKSLRDMYKTLYPETKTDDLTLTQAREAMGKFMEVLKG